MRIALIHALKHSIVPIEASFARLWPDATLMNVLDDSLSADVARDGRLTSAMTDARIDQDGKLAGILRPGWNKPPAHQAKMPCAVFDENHGYRLRG